MNSYTETPVNTVIFDAGFAILLGPTSLSPGRMLSTRFFSISVISLYVRIQHPDRCPLYRAERLQARTYFISEFSLVFVNRIFFYTSLTTFRCIELSDRADSCTVHGIHERSVHVPYNSSNDCTRHELLRSGAGRCHDLLVDMVLLPKIWRHLLVHGSHSYVGPHESCIRGHEQKGGSQHSCPS